MTKYATIVALITTLMLSGCDVTQLVQKLGITEPALVFAPATELQISDTETAYVVGHDECPEQSDSIFLADLSMTFMPNGCINLGNENQEVLVEMRIAERYVSEIWQVTHQSDGVVITRPNGFVVRKPSD
ncbi:hypothetical protein [Vibrio coralliilyticus]|uniref:Lipoprotein n=1 Tax=Vibrio coralliilyticus TaxID=190893 RepID=A0AAP6ZNE7_9VIBR|nr:hypothetical protein [Vibrio coralliilyticus]NOI32034.1 hypothetical protein [Vibrio coralliilyticus]NOJ25235.1 hypothetical protein [Vibrio coralliilyticus]